MEIIAGVDEAGRGPLAGPVVASAVILPQKHTIEGLKDSKKCSPKKREILFQEIKKQALSVGIGIVHEKEIDTYNILRSTQKAMQMALGRLKQKPDKALIDGYPLPTQIISNEGIIGGDKKIESIMAASIVAKVTRDSIMNDYDRIFPDFGFKKNKGYGTAEHLTALVLHKATPIHRKTFNPVQNNLPTLTWLREEKKVGKLGEQLVALKYYGNGYTIIEMNRTCGHYGEIDIIAEKNRERVFIEVKTMSKKQLGAPEQKVDKIKLKKLHRAVLKYLSEQEEELEVRLDVVTVILGKGEPRLKQFRGVSFDE